MYLAQFLDLLGRNRFIMSRTALAKPTLRKAVFYLAWGIVLILSACFVLLALSYFNFDLENKFLGSKVRFLGNKLWLVSFYVHIAFGAIAVITGALLFFKRIVHYSSKVHKWIGKVYILSILFITGPTGFYLAFFAEGGPFATVGFMLMSFAWMVPTYMAYHKIRKGDIRGHYKWIIRSYCMTLSGITLRLITPVGTHIMELDYQTNFVMTSYACWMINIALGELILLANRNQLNNLSTLLKPTTNR